MLENGKKLGNVNLKGFWRQDSGWINVQIGYGAL